jgi:hypothetical protein
VFPPEPWDRTASISSGKNGTDGRQKSLSYADLRLTYHSSDGILATYIERCFKERFNASLL